jgi:hypothetical protein
MGAAVAEGNQPDGQGAPAPPGLRHPSGITPAPLRLEGLLLIDSAGNDPVMVDAVTFADEGIGVIRWSGSVPRILPWSSVVAHVIERWDGGPVPRWWLDPEPPGDGSTGNGATAVGAAAVGATASSTTASSTTASSATASSPTASSATASVRPLPHVPPGVLIGVRSPFGWYRFIFPGGDPSDVSRRVTAIAVRHQGPTGASSVTRVVAWGHDVERRQSVRQPSPPSGWTRVRPYLVVLLVLVIATAVTLILLQSAGAIHLPLLGGSSPGTIAGLRTR